jgi:hypothetical protein
MRMLQPMQSIVLFLVAKADKGENQKKVSYHPLDTKSLFFISSRNKFKIHVTLIIYSDAEITKQY